MFSKFTAFLQQAAEVTSQVLAPQVSKHEDFAAHWRAITETMSTDMETESTTESTGVGTRLSEMMDILCREEEERNPKDPGTMGPCMEFVLRHKILDTLYTMGKSDYPTGMSHQVLVFLTVTLGRIERPILHHVSIHQPILKQVDNCGLTLSKRCSADEVHFIQTLCIRLQRDPRLADFFIKEEKDSKKQFMIAEALLRLVHSEDNVVVLKAYECLLTCVSLQHTTVSQALASGQLPVHLASQLQYHVQLIPVGASVAAVLNCQAGWGIDYATRRHKVDHSPDTHGLWHIEAFLSWLDFCEQIVGVCEETLANVLCFTIHEMLLSAAILPRLIKQSEDSVLVSTAVLAKSIQTLSCRKLLEEFVSFTLKERYDPRVNSKSPLLIEILVSRIDHNNPEICQVTLKLFDVLLSSPLPYVIQELFLSHWSPIIAHTNSTPLTNPSHSSPTTTHTTSTPVTMLTNSTPTLPSPTSVTTITTSTPIITPTSPTPLTLRTYSMLSEEELFSVKRDLEELMRDYLSLLPDSLLSCEEVMGNPGLEQYLIEAHHQVAQCRAVSAGLSTSSGDSTVSLSPLNSTLSSIVTMSPSDSAHPIAEGPLLTALLNKLECLLDQPYGVNLLLTSILSRLASFTHPMMDWLYSTHTKHKSRNIYSVLNKLAGDLRAHAERSPGLAVNIVEARRRLCGMVTSDLLSMPQNDLLEGAIVLEEFTKEMSSVVFAKAMTALLTLPTPNDCVQ